MKTDRELLELAAKAAGIVLDYGRNVTGIPPSSLHYLDAPYWAPLTDDGDALRLAVELELDVDHEPKGTYVWSRQLDDFVFEQCGSGRLDATRRAIVRAAAAIGERME